VLDVVTELIGDGTLGSLSEVEEIACEIGPLASGLLIYDEPKTGLEGKFSIQYCVAVALLDKRAGLAQFTDARAADPALQALVRRIRKRVDPLVDPAGDFGTRITLNLSGGRRVTRLVVRAMGRHGAQALPREQIDQKFRECAALCLHDTAVDGLVRVALGLESLADIRTLTQCIRSGLRS
jgi:2-methylcitrate dehydratase PrpD